ncbi:MAG: hypothetical protein KDD63_15425 [Bacteroidetes bacterium]|nr:hypothetical protein [Bacteroidota bacterium]
MIRISYLKQEDKAVNKNFKQKLLDKISQGKLDEAFTEIRNSTTFSYDHTIIALNLRYSIIKEEKIKGLIKVDDYIVLVNQIGNDLLQYIKILDTKDLSAINKTGENIISKNLVAIKKDLEGKKTLRASINKEIDNLNEAIFEVAQHLNKLKTGNGIAMLKANTTPFVGRIYIDSGDEILSLIKKKLGGLKKEIIIKWGIIIIIGLQLLIILLLVKNN